MSVVIKVSTTDTNDRVFLTWAPVKASAQQAPPAAAPVTVMLTSGGAADGGQVAFKADANAKTPAAAQLQLQLPADGSPVEFFVAGVFQHPSRAYGDAAIVATDAGGMVLARRDAMVRIRKDAETLMPPERDRFLQALGRLNDAGKGPFKAFREMHVAASVGEAHGGAGFPPWHRAYLLDLERSLQNIDPTVALPYWRFDAPQPNLFEPNFLGMPPADPREGDQVQFPPGHALQYWTTDGVVGIDRRPIFDVKRPPPVTYNNQPWVISEHDTIAASDQYAVFRGMEGAPHGSAHVSFDGPIDSIPTAARDPLFFLLHANVDRLWAKWQWFYKRHDPDDAATFSPSPRIGHRLNDTMWPWNGSTTAPRPNFPPPGGAMQASPITAVPGAMPTVRSMIDYQGVNGGESLGFDYDDVPFEP